jgi:hypothetical protein
MNMPLDKILHFCSGGFIAACVALAFREPMLGFYIAIVAGITKEGVDRISNWWYTRRGQSPRHTVDFWDFLWTVIGGAAGAILVAVFDKASI